MSKLIISLLTAAGIAFAGAAGAADKTTMSRDAYKADKDKIEAQHKTDRAQCSSLSGNAKDVCQAEAKGKEKVAKAELEANYKNTDKARNDARVAKADAVYDVAKEKCDDMAGNQKDVCVKEAKAAHTKSKADAKVANVSNKATQAWPRHPAIRPPVALRAIYWTRERLEQGRPSERREAGGRAQGRAGRYSRRAVQGRSREMRCDERREEGCLRQAGEGSIRQDLTPQR